MNQAINRTQEEQQHRHSPTLNTVLMVEDVLQEAREVMTLAQIKRRLPKKVMHQTLTRIIDYLQASGKVVIGTKGILWIYTPRDELRRLAEGGLQL